MEIETRTLLLTIHGQPARIPGVAGWKRVPAHPAMIPGAEDWPDSVLILGDDSDTIAETEQTVAEVQAAWDAAAPVQAVEVERWQFGCFNGDSDQDDAKAPKGWKPAGPWRLLNGCTNEDWHAFNCERPLARIAAEEGS